jgi:transposase
VLPPAIRRKIVDLKAEHPPLNLEEIANVCGVLFGRRPDGHTVKAVLEESAIPRKLVRRFEPYHETDDVKESREAVVTLHRQGWSDKSIARYLKVDRSTVYRVRRRFEEEGEEGLEDRPGGRPRGVAKVDLRAMNEVRKMQENPELGEFRVHAALERMGIRLSPRTVGRILAANRHTSLAPGVSAKSRQTSLWRMSGPFPCTVAPRTSKRCSRSCFPSIRPTRGPFRFASCGVSAIASAVGSASAGFRPRSTAVGMMPQANCRFRVRTKPH